MISEQETGHVVAIIMEEGLANIFVISQAKTILKARVEKSEGRGNELREELQKELAALEQHKGSVASQSGTLQGLQERLEVLRAAHTKQLAAESRTPFQSLQRLQWSIRRNDKRVARLKRELG